MARILQYDYKNLHQLTLWKIYSFQQNVLGLPHVPLSQDCMVQKVFLKLTVSDKMYYLTFFSDIKNILILLLITSFSISSLFLIGLTSQWGCYETIWDFVVYSNIFHRHFMQIFRSQWTIKNDLVLKYSFIAQVLTAKNYTTDKNLPRKKPGQWNFCCRISINSIILFSLRDFIQLASKTFTTYFVRKLTSQVVSIP